MIQLTLLQKREIILYVENNPSVSLTEVHEIFQKKFKTTFGYSTLRGWIVDKNKILDDTSVSVNKKSKRKREGKYKDLEKVLFEWIKRQENNNNPIKDNNIIEQADKFAKLMEIPDWKAFTNGTLSRFKKKT